MSERGFFNMDRGWFDHPSFAPEPYTEREAWAWLISEAAWKPCTARVGAAVVDLKRGQVAHSLRFMAERWKWQKDRVRRYLHRLEKRDMIATANATAITVITICNYNRYQSPHSPSATPVHQKTRQHRDREEETKQKTQQTQKSHTPRAVAIATRPGSGSSFDEFWEAYPRRGEAANPRKPARDKFDRHIRAGHDPALIIAAARRYADVERRSGRAGTDKIAQAITWLDEERWKDYPALAAVASERASGFFIREGTDQWDAWQVHLRATTGRGSPIDKNGGWYRPSEWPPVSAAVVRGH